MTADRRAKLDMAINIVLEPAVADRAADPKVASIPAGIAAERQLVLREAAAELVEIIIGPARADERAGAYGSRRPVETRHQRLGLATKSVADVEVLPVVAAIDPEPHAVGGRRAGVKRHAVDPGAAAERGDIGHQRDLARTFQDRQGIVGKQAVGGGGRVDAV